MHDMECPSDGIHRQLRSSNVEGIWCRAMDKDESVEQTLATVHALLRAEDLSDAAAIVREYPFQVELTGYDNWNGGTNFLEYHFKIPAEQYARLGAKRSQLEEQISRMGEVVSKLNEGGRC